MCNRPENALLVFVTSRPVGKLESQSCKQLEESHNSVEASQQTATLVVLLCLTDVVKRQHRLKSYIQAQPER